ncbi:FHA domain-containing protein [Schumannella sp. 10F1B-5-1]|uniref:FHA domain-containing protein n=1 Tax=Schumannella sp. 10F1B-5-1 TaxID=2590780 RepID=UPI001130BA2F|nr:FHA domain-containing protein [Schumannella sp. 10F1B-5-1]TPW76743.1 FHA domain-containing protein [Schumannella sp. 10F1B-5-1]
MSASTSPAGAATCWNCRQALPADSARCPFCGVPQQASSAALVVAPGGVVAAAPPPSAPLVPGLGESGAGGAGGAGGVGAPSARGAAPGIAAAGTGAGVAAPAGPAAGPAADAARGIVHGVRTAGVGRRLAALTIDVIVVAAVGAGVHLLLDSVVLTALAVAELVLGLIVLQARTGLGLGNLLLRLRVARLDRPWSPGLGRSALRSIVSGAGWLVGGIGAWFVEVTSAFDGSGRRRSWGDLAAGTVVVAIPRRRERERGRAVPRPTTPGARDVVAVDAGLPPTAASGALGAPVALDPVAIPASAPAPVPTAAPVPDPDPIPAPLEVLPLPGILAPAASPDLSPVEPAPAAPLDPPTEQVDRPRGLDGHAELTFTELPGRAQVVLAFDTGQNERSRIPAALVLGRSPSADDDTEIPVTVRDPESTVSKAHARLELSRSGTWLTDLGSTNGTFLLDETGEAERLAPGARTAVDDGMRFRLGSRVVTLSTLLEDSE